VKGSDQLPSNHGDSQDNTVRESFLLLQNHERMKKVLSRREDAYSDKIFDYIENFITAGIGMVRLIRCKILITKANIINCSEISRLSLAIHHLFCPL